MNIFNTLKRESKGIDTKQQQQQQQEIRKLINKQKQFHEKHFHTFSLKR
jgi:hypothetical protein